MKSFRFAAAVAVLLVSAAPATAQHASTSDQFFEAIDRLDGGRMVQLIQENPLIVDVRDNKGDSGLIHAIRKGESRWIGFLLNKGANPNLAGAKGETPLITAARTGQLESVTWLLGLGAKVDATNKAGETALIVAVQQRNARLVKLLLDAGADPDRTDAAAGYSARDYAKRDNRSREIQKLIDDKKPKGGAK